MGLGPRLLVELGRRGCAVGARFGRRVFRLLVLLLFLALLLHLLASLRAWAVPANVVLLYFANKADAFEHVCDIVDPAFLDVKLGDCYI